VDVEIFLDQNDRPSATEADIGQIFQGVGIIRGGVTVRDFDIAPALAFDWGKHHEQIGGAVALVLIIDAGQASRFHRDQYTRFGKQLL
jgi:hypothetical protein